MYKSAAVCSILKLSVKVSVGTSQERTVINDVIILLFAAGYFVARFHWLSSLLLVLQLLLQLAD